MQESPGLTLDWLYEVTLFSSKKLNSVLKIIFQIFSYILGVIKLDINLGFTYHIV